MADKNKPEKGNPGEDGIDYRLEGNSPGGEEKKDPTDEGYDEAAHSGGSRYALPSGAGGVFGTTGGGGPAEGFQVIERPRLYDRTGEAEEFDPDSTDRLPTDRQAQVTFGDAEEEERVAGRKE